MEDVAIIGVGMHPFGRFPGKSAIEMAAEAVRAACADAGTEWKDVQFAFGGSAEVDNPDAVIGLLGPDRHPVHGRVQRLRHGGHGIADGGRRHPVRQVRHRRGRRDGQARPRRLHRRPRRLRGAVVVRRDGLLPDDEVLRDEDQPVHARSRDLARDPGSRRGEGVPERGAQPERVPAQAPGRGGHPRVTDAQLPPDPVHVLLARRGGGRGGAVPGRHRLQVLLEPDLPAGRRRCAPAATGPTRSTARGPRSSGTTPRRSTRRVPRTRRPASAPRTSTSCSCRTPTRAPR